MQVGRRTYHHGISNTWDVDLTIGHFCSVADGLTVIGSKGRHAQLVTTFPFEQFYQPNLNLYPTDQVLIGNDVWIGYGVTLIGSLIVGDGAIIGARAVVTKDVPPYAVVVGNPARVVRYRFSPEQIKSLLAMKWWEWDDETLESRVPDMVDIEVFLAKYGSAD